MPVRPAPELGSVDAIIDATLGWVHEAGNPYFDFLFGTEEATRTSLPRWMRRGTSEVSIENMHVITRGDEIVGGFVAMDGERLHACRRADTLALMMATGREGRAALKHRLEIVENLFTPVEPEQFYLSKVGISRAHRGGSLFSELMHAYFRAGAAAGHTRFRLDVSADRARVIDAYRAFSFEVMSTSTTADVGMTYVAMTRDDDAR